MQKENKTDLIIVRHGQATHNLGSQEAHIFAGSEIDNELAPEGITDAEFLAQEIKKQGLVDVILTSPLKRASQTAEIIAHTLGHVSIVTVDELCEMNIGSFAGLTEAEVRRLYPKAAEDFYGEKINKWDFPGGENFAEVSLRLDRALVKIKKISKGKKRVVICGHGLTNRVLFYKLVPKNKALWQERSYPHDRIEIIKV